MELVIMKQDITVYWSESSMWQISDLKCVRLREST